MLRKRRDCVPEQYKGFGHSKVAYKQSMVADTSPDVTAGFCLISVVGSEGAMLT